MADPADVNVDEMRRRARRRLVGAIVLALCAAVIVPMLLESDPKPLGDSVAIKIPQVDDSKFVNRLSDGAPKTDAVPKDTRKDAAPDGAPRKSVADAERAVVSPGAKAPKYDTQVAADKGSTTPPPSSAPVPAAPPPSATSPAPPPSATPPSATPPAPAKDASPSTGGVAPVPPSPPPGTTSDAAAPKEDAKPVVSPKTEPKAEPKAEVKSEPKAPVEAAPPPASNGVLKDGFSVQLAAFSDDRGANALAGRLKRGGYPAYTEPLKTSRGTLWRVRVGPYPTRDAANGVRDKLKTEGQSGIVAPSR